MASCQAVLSRRRRNRHWRRCNRWIRRIDWPRRVRLHWPNLFRERPQVARQRKEPSGAGRTAGTPGGDLELIAFVGGHIDLEESSRPRTRHRNRLAMEPQTTGSLSVTIKRQSQAAHEHGMPDPATNSRRAVCRVDRHVPSMAVLAAQQSPVLAQVLAAEAARSRSRNWRRGRSSRSMGRRCMRRLRPKYSCSCDRTVRSMFRLANP